MKLVTITPHHDRLDQLGPHLSSIAWQTRPPDEVVVSAHADTQETRRAIIDLLDQHIDALSIPRQFWAVGELGDPWRKPLCVNFALRRTPPGADVLVTLDCDMILHPCTLQELERAFAEAPRRYVMCPNLSLPHGLEMGTPGSKYSNLEFFEALRSHAVPVGWRGHREEPGPYSLGIGGLQGASRAWWFAVRGLDEEMSLWGSEDEDISRRAAATGLAWHWLPRQLSMLHQWHPAGQLTGDPVAKQQRQVNARISRAKLRAGQHVRNPNGWGGLP